MTDIDLVLICYRCGDVPKFASEEGRVVVRCSRCLVSGDLHQVKLDAGRYFTRNEIRDRLNPKKLPIPTPPDFIFRKRLQGDKPMTTERTATD